MIQKKLEQQEQAKTAKTYSRLSNSNIDAYVQAVYGVQQLKEYRKLSSFQSILQKNYGGSNDGDCSLCAITAVGAYKLNYTESFDSIYRRVRKVAEGYFANPDKFGTIPVFIKNIINDSFLVKSRAKYLKNVGFNWQTIKTQLKENNPIVLSISKDGRNYYEAHSITIVGYREYTKNAKLLLVYDNWHNDISYVDFNLLGTSCCINYF